MAVWFVKCREEWFYWSAWYASALFILPFFPIGSVLAVAVFLHLKNNKQLYVKAQVILPDTNSKSRVSSIPFIVAIFFVASLALVYIASFYILKKGVSNVSEDINKVATQVKMGASALPKLGNYRRLVARDTAERDKLMRLLFDEDIPFDLNSSPDLDYLIISDQYIGKLERSLAAHLIRVDYQDIKLINRDGRTLISVESTNVFSPEQLEQFQQAGP